MFPDDKINEKAGDDIDDKGERCGEAELMNEKAHNKTADHDADAGPEEEIKNFKEWMVATGFEYPLDTEQVGGEVGKEEGDDIINDRMACADDIRDGRNG
jgi:hypothetical protein